MKPQPLANWLHPSAEQLGALLSHVQMLRRCTAGLREALPAPLAAECQAANIDGTTLVVAVSSSAWAAKLRYQLTAVLSQLQARNTLPAIDGLRIRVQPLRVEEFKRPVSRPPLSEKTLAFIEDVADGTIDPDLRAALKRLVRHAAKKAP